MVSDELTIVLSLLLVNEIQLFDTGGYEIIVAN